LAQALSALVNAALLPFCLRIGLSMMSVTQQICIAVAGLAFAAAGGPVQREPVAHLRAVAGDSEDMPWRASVESAISHFVAPNVQAVAVQGATAKGDNSKKMPQKLSVQVPKETVDKFIDTLSDKCGTRFAQILSGKGPQLHTFGSADEKTTEASCAKLGGAICITAANVVKEKQAQNGRKTSSTMSVTGDGCLPKECMAQHELALLSGFMLMRAKETAPGAGTKMQLHVDCRKSGGSDVTVGDGAPLLRSAAAGESSLFVMGMALMMMLCFHRV